MKERQKKKRGERKKERKLRLLFKINENAL